MSGASLERVVLASANPKKVAELRELLDGQLDVVARPLEVPEVVEDADTFLGNARLKASALVAATGLAALADDSGLEVEALGGRPGVHSARFAGVDASDDDNVDLLLAELSGRADPAQRRARFRCVIVLQRPDGSELVAEGSADGSITAARRGAGGFGYDPVFVPDDGDGSSYAEMAPAAKHAISHRGRALANLLTQLRAAR